MTTHNLLEDELEIFRMARMKCILHHFSVSFPRVILLMNSVPSPNMHSIVPFLFFSIKIGDATEIPNGCLNPCMSL